MNAPSIFRIAAAARGAGEEGRMSRRELDLAIARIAGYHDDSRRFTRLVVESRVRRQLLDAAWRTGVDQKRHGMPCSCPDCKRAAS